MNRQAGYLVLFGLCFAMAGCSVSYRQAAGMFDTEPLLEAGWLHDGESISVTILKDGKPAAGHELIIDTRPEPVVLEISEQGVVEVPVRREWLSENPRVEVRGADGTVPIWRLRASVAFTAALNSSICETPEDATFYDLGDFQAHAAGPDIVYAEPGIGAEDIDKAVQRLAQEREALRELFGTEPVAFGVVLLDSDPVRYRFNTDSKGRSVIGIRREDRDDPETAIGTVVHEWTHEILAKNFKIERDPDVRYLEDGLCEYVAHRTELAIRGTQTSSTLLSRAKGYGDREGLEARGTLDLAQLEKHNYPAERPKTISENLAALRTQMCEQPFAQPGLGYEVGLAWWLSQQEADPQYLQKTLAALEANPDLRAVLTQNQPGVSMHAVPHETVLEIFKRHGS